jgi:hypothetical protein
MSGSARSDHQAAIQQRPARRSQRARKGHVNEEASISEPGDETESAFWAHLEAREEGRFTTEADHLFDTSYTWAA